MENLEKIQEKKGWTSRNPVMLKIGVVIVLMLLLLIPSAMIESIIEEREQMNQSAIEEVSSKWANQQKIKGPILTIPLLLEIEDEKGEKKEYIQNWYILPDELTIQGNVSPESLKRGIYEIIVYSSQLKLNGSFSLENTLNNSSLKEIQFDKAFLTIGISDLRGIKNKIKLKWGDETLSVKPGTKIPTLVESGITIPLKLQNIQGQTQFDFSFDLSLEGSKNLSFVPIGATTNVSIISNWSAPSFVGNFLPDNREVNDEGFDATWRVLQLNRNFPQSWVNENHNYTTNIESTTFGVNLLLPLDDYQKSMRSAKYGAMTIMLTFLIFFLVEVINKIRIHPLQYTMVGVALCLFYILLVSISEHSNFDFAFGISSIAIVSMISLYSLTLFKNMKLSVMLMMTLYGIYSFLFITLQMVDYALLMGSIGLTIILGVTMFYTRKINWYQISLETN